MDIPQAGKISKDAKECMQECASELLSFITSEYRFRVLDKQVHAHTIGICIDSSKAWNVVTYVIPSLM